MLLLVGTLLAAPVDIPAGAFKLGKSPVRDITLPPYRIDATEVTVADF
jgi:formylglycine-generating enzyme required for sulfatase activity